MLKKACGSLVLDILKEEALRCVSFCWIMLCSCQKGDLASVTKLVIVGVGFLMFVPHRANRRCRVILVRAARICTVGASIICLEPFGAFNGKNWRQKMCKIERRKSGFFRAGLSLDIYGRHVWLGDVYE